MKGSEATKRLCDVQHVNRVELLLRSHSRDVRVCAEVSPTLKSLLLSLRHCTRPPCGTRKDDLVLPYFIVPYDLIYRIVLYLIDAFYHIIPYWIVSDRQADRRTDANIMFDVSMTFDDILEHESSGNVSCCLVVSFPEASSLLFI